MMTTTHIKDAYEVGPIIRRSPARCGHCSAAHSKGIVYIRMIDHKRSRHCMNCDAVEAATPKRLSERDRKIKRLLESLIGEKV